MESEGSLLCSQEPTICPYFEQMNPVYTWNHIFKIHFNVILPSVPISSRCYVVLVSNFLYCMLPVDKEVYVVNRIVFVL
jgi:hypothetical protein